MSMFVHTIWFEVLVIAIACAVVVLGCRYNPFIPGKIKNEKISGIILLIGAAATAMWILGELLAHQ